MPVCQAIGIDLGTTYSCVAGYSPHDTYDHTPQVFLNGIGQATTPSWIAFTEQGRSFGKAAVQQHSTNAENTIYDVKRVIGRLYDDPVVEQERSTVPFKMFSCPGTSVIKYRVKDLDDKVEEYTCEQISGMLLRSLANSAESVLGQPPAEAVITVPAHFNDSQRRATKDAGVIAGLKVLRIVNEPTAAAIAYYGLDNKDLGEDLVLVYDLGGGTFDVSILRSETDSSDGFVSLEVEATGGNSHLGGRDFDRKIADYFDEEYKKRTGKTLKFSNRYWSRLLVECEIVKIELSTRNQVQLDVGKIYGGSFDFVSSISRARFEQLIRNDLAKTTDIIDSTLKDAKIERKQIKRVLLVGGSTKIPKVRALIKSLFPDNVTIDDHLNPDEVVARGAALLAAHLSGDYLSTIGQETTICLLDVTPLSLGTDILGGKMSVIIPRNSMVPSAHTQTYCTTSDNQIRVDVKVYQGERIDLSNNHFLGEFTIDGVPPRPKKTENVEVKFEIDVDGILQVTAKIQSTEQTKSIIIGRNKMNLDPDEVTAMLEDFEKYALRDAEWQQTVDAEIKLKDELDRAKKSFRYGNIPALKTFCHEIDTWLKADSASRSTEDYDSRREKLSSML